MEVILNLSTLMASWGPLEDPRLHFDNRSASGRVVTSQLEAKGRPGLRWGLRGSQWPVSAAHPWGPLGRKRQINSGRGRGLCIEYPEAESPGSWGREGPAVHGRHLLFKKHLKKLSSKLLFKHPWLRLCMVWIFNSQFFYQMILSWCSNFKKHSSNSSK